MAQSRWIRTLVVLAVVILTAALALAAGELLLRIGDVLLLFLLAGLLAFALMPLVDLLERPRLPRPVVVLICYLLVGVVLAGIGTLVLPALLEQSNQVLQRLPGTTQLFENPNSPLATLLARLGLPIDLRALGGSLGSSVQELGKALLGDVLGIAKGVSTALVNVVLVFVIGFYFLNEGHELRRKLLNVTPKAHLAKLEFLEDTAGRVLGGYLRGQLLVALMVGVLAGAGSGAVGLQYAVVIGTLAGIFELIPFFGPVLSAIPAVGLALLQGPLLRVVAILIIFVIIQQVESNIIGPRITGHAVGLHPLVVMFSILVGVELAGIWGAIFAVPVAGVLVAVLRKLYSPEARQERALDRVA